MKLSRMELAEIIGTDQKQIWRYETGKNDPTGEMIISLARALETSADWLLGLTDEIRPLKQGSETGLTDNEREILNIMRLKSVDQQRKIVEIARVV